MTSEMWSVTVENFGAGFEILDCPNDDPGSVKTVDHARIARMVHQTGSRIECHRYAVLEVSIKIEVS